MNFFVGRWIAADKKLPPPLEIVLGCLGDDTEVTLEFGWVAPRSIGGPKFATADGPGWPMRQLLYWTRIGVPRGLRARKQNRQGWEFTKDDQAAIDAMLRNKESHGTSS